MKDEKKDILDQRDKGISQARGALAKLFRTILYDLQIGGPEWEVLMQRVLDDPRGPAPRNSKDRSSLKGNLNKALKGDRMSWKKFMEALRLLGPAKAKIEVHLIWPKGKTTIHDVITEVGGFRDEDYANNLAESERDQRHTVNASTGAVPQTPVVWDPSDPKAAIHEAMQAIQKMCATKPKRSAVIHDRSRTRNTTQQ